MTQNVSCGVFLTDTKVNLRESLKMAYAPGDLAATLQNYLAQGRCEPRCAAARRNTFHGRFRITRAAQRIIRYIFITESESAGRIRTKIERREKKG